jgi:23S rRNA (adenine-N6)-dimethyltransferase
VVARGSRATGPAPPAPHGQHFLDRKLGAELVRRARIAPHETVFEIGAGTGALTRELARVAKFVLAIEVDPRLAAGLRRTCAEAGNIAVIEADALRNPLPRVPFRAFGNIPFASTTALMRRLLDDPRTTMTAADLIVQWEVARKRTASPPGNVLSLCWGTRWSFEIARRIPAAAFRPKPHVDGALLAIRPLDPPLLRLEEARPFEKLVRIAFLRAGEPLARALRPVCRSSEVRRLQRKLCLPSSARPIDLDVQEWVTVYRFLGRS